MANLRNLIIVVCFLFGCAGRSTVETPIETGMPRTINLDEAFTNSKTVRLSEIADSVSFLPLETNTSSLSGVVQRFSFSPTYIFDSNRYFDWNGKYGGKIGRQGNGPYEEPEGVSRVLFKGNHFYSRAHKLIEYDSTGKPTKVKPLIEFKDVIERSTLHHGEAFYAIEGGFALLSSLPLAIYFFDNEFNFITSKRVVYADFPSWAPSLGGMNGITSYEDKALFFNCMNDTIFHVKGTQLEPRWFIKFTDRRLPSDVILHSYDMLREIEPIISRRGSMENTNYVKLTDNKHIVDLFYETQHYVLFFMREMIVFAPSRGKTYPDPYLVCYDKATGKTTRINGKGYVDDLMGMDYFYPKHGVYEEKLISAIWPHELFDHIEVCKEKGQEVHPKLLALSKIVKPDDNPILIFVHLKKKP